MPLDPSIILQAGKGVTPLKDPSEIADEQAARQMRQLQLQQAQQGITDDQAYRSALQSGASGEALIGDLQKRGLGKQAMEYQKFQTEQQKTQGERGKMVAEGMKNGAAMILANPTEQNAIDTLTMAQKQYGLPQEMVDGAKAKIYAARNDPNALKQLAVGWGGDAEKVLGKFTNVNLGGVESTQRTNPITGAIEVAGTQARTQSPDSVASVGQSASNNAATVAATLRGQDMRAAQATATANQKTAPKPLPAAALKMQQEGLDAIGTASSINADLDAVNKQIADGKLKFGPASNLINRGMNAAGMSSEESRNFASFQANMEKLRNDSLRLNKGVQTDGDAQRAWNELFSNINDTEVVKQRLAEIKRLNERAVDLRKLDIDNVRSNYGHDPLDTEKYTKVPTALNGGNNKASEQTADQPKTKPINIGGQDFMAERAPDGKYYVQKNGKWFEVR